MKLQDDTNKILELPNMVLIYKMKEKRTTLQMRLSKYGWTMEEALNTKVYGKR